MKKATPGRASSPSNCPIPHTDFDGAFTPGTVFLMDRKEYTIETEKWATLVVPSGQIVVSDVLQPGWVKPFKRSVTPGRYPVSLSWNGSETCAILVRFSRRKVARWEPALRRGEKSSNFDQNNPPCFGVDTGMAGIFDVKAASVAASDDDWYQRFTTAYSRHHSIKVDEATGAGVVWCFSGYGDGGYPSYWGLDRSGSVACLAVDFLVLVEPVYEDHEISNLHEKMGQKLSDPWFARFGYSEVRLSWKSKARKEIQFEYHGGFNSLEVRLLNGRGKEVHAGVYEGGGLGPRKVRKVLDVNKDKKAKLVLRHLVGVRAVPRLP